MRVVSEVLKDSGLTLFIFLDRGVNNDFLIRTLDPLALRYNDTSPMENHHVAAAFTLLNGDGFDFFPKKSKVSE